METRKRSIVKSVTFRIIATIITFIIVWIFTQDVGKSLIVTIVENLVKMIAYYFHERAWIKTSWGLKKDKVSQERNELETAGYGLLHLRSSYKWKQVRVDFGVENVFDKFYYDPLGGAYLGQGKTMSATDVAWGQAVPAIGRSIYAGLNFKF